MDNIEALTAFNALSQDTRLEVFRFLIQVGPEGITAGEISDQLDVIQNTMSTNLSILERAGLIEKQREGRNIRYRANYDGIKDLLLYLLRDCCGCKESDLKKTMKSVFPNCC